MEKRKNNDKNSYIRDLKLINFICSSFVVVGVILTFDVTALLLLAAPFLILSFTFRGLINVYESSADLEQTKDEIIDVYGMSLDSYREMQESTDSYIKQMEDYIEFVKNEYVPSLNDVINVKSERIRVLELMLRHKDDV